MKVQDNEPCFEISENIKNNLVEKLEKGKTYRLMIEYWRRE